MRLIDDERPSEDLLAIDRVLRATFAKADIEPPDEGELAVTLNPAPTGLMQGYDGDAAKTAAAPRICGRVRLDAEPVRAVIPAITILSEVTPTSDDCAAEEQASARATAVAPSR